MLFRATFVSVVISLFPWAAFAADAIGVPACDDFLAKYQACVTNKVPVKEKAMMQSGVDEMRKGWLGLAKLVEDKEIDRKDLENICKQAPAQMKQTFDSFGCSLK